MVRCSSHGRPPCSNRATVALKSANVAWVSSMRAGVPCVDRGVAVRRRSRGHLIELGRDICAWTADNDHRLVGSFQVPPVWIRPVHVAMEAPVFADRGFVDERQMAAANTSSTAVTSSAQGWVARSVLAKSLRRLRKGLGTNTVSSRHRSSGHDLDVRCRGSECSRR